MKLLVFIVLGVLIWGPLFAGEKSEKCNPISEYMTVHSYLNDSKDLALKEDEIRAFADQVSKGCDHAARRFIHVAESLLKTGLGSRNSLELARDFSLLKDQQTQAFLVIFKRAYLESGLNLSVKDAVKVALTLSSQFDGNFDEATRDFEKMIAFCVSGKGLDLPRKSCGEFAARIAAYGSSFKEGVASSFQEAFYFIMQDEDGPRRSTAEALQVAEEVISHGPTAVSNFKRGFEFAISEKGLKLDQLQALAFARKIAARSQKRVKEKIDEQL